MGQRSAILARILGFDGWSVEEHFFETKAGKRVEAIGPFQVNRETRLVLRVRPHWLPRCSGCGTACSAIHESGKPRRWRDLPWADHHMVIEYCPRRLKCDSCGHVVEMVAWADPGQRMTRRLQHRLALDCSAAPVTYVAHRYDLSWPTVRNAEEQAIMRWERTRTPSMVTMLGVDEKFLGRRNKLAERFVTIVSDLASGEPIWIGMGRRKKTLGTWLAALSVEERKRIDVIAMDMHAPFYEAVATTPGLEHVTIAHDAFHVVRRVNDAVDEVRRATFFRAGPGLRGVGRGKRWLFLRAWENSTTAQQAELRRLLAMNGKLARAYQLKEEIRDLVRNAPDGDAMLKGLERVWRRTTRSSLRALHRLGASLRDHVDGIVALAEFRPPAGRIEALNNNWEALVRRGRGYRDHNYLLRKLRFMIANPLRSAAGRDAFARLGHANPVEAAA